MEDNSDDDVQNLTTEANKAKKFASSSDTLATDVRIKIQDAFRVFDHENNNTVDVREIGTIIRSLGFGPSESELQEILRDMEDPQQMGYIQFERFYPVMSKIITQHKYELCSSEQLLQAFKVLDTQEKGCLSVEEIKRYFVQFGEPFAQDEMEELLSASVTPNSRNIHYKTFVHTLTIDEEQKL